MQWHLARDNQIKLAKFCEKHAIRHDNVEPYQVGDAKYFQHTYHFDNDSFIRAELRAGDTKSYSVADHFQVVDYAWGNK
jgi:hypothetical protein